MMTTYHYIRQGGDTIYVVTDSDKVLYTEIHKCNNSDKFKPETAFTLVTGTLIVCAVLITWLKTKI